MATFFYDLFYALPLYWAFLILKAEDLGLPKTRFLTVFVAIVVLLLVAGVFDGRGRLRFLCFLLPVIMFAAVVIVKKPSERAEFMAQNLWLLWVLLAAAVVFVAGRLLSASLIIKIAGIAAILTYLVVSMLQKNEPGKAVVSLLFVQILLLMVDIIQRSWKKTGCENNKEHFVYVAPFILLIGLLIFKLPAKSEPYDWSFARNIFHAAKEGVLSASRCFSFGGDDYATGFTEDVAMASKVSGKAEKLFDISLNNAYGEVQYITGKSFDSFDGKKWSSTGSKEGAFGTLDAIELLCAVNKCDRTHVSDYIRPAQATVKYAMFNTKYMFLPTKTFVQKGEYSKLEPTEHQDSVLSTKRLGYGLFYTVPFYVVNRDSLPTLIDNATPISKEEWDDKIRHIEATKRSIYSYDAYLSYKETLKRDYTDTYALSAELEALLKEVYGAETNPFMRLERLESWLGSFRYTNDLPDYPESFSSEEDFLEYFLLQRREGYCVHFATAFVLLARHEGFASRLFEGFYVKTEGSKEFTINSDMAHAWPEVYFDNVGWIPFEPTPTYKYSYSWATGGLNRKEPTVSPEEFFAPQPVEEVLPIVNTCENLQEKTGLHNNIVLYLVPLLVCLFSVILFFFVYAVVTKRRLDELDYDKKARLYSRICLYILQLCGLRFLEGETISEYISRVSESVPNGCLSFAAEYEKLLYSNKKGTIEVFKTIRTCEEMLLEGLKVKRKISYPIVIFAVNLRFSALVQETVRRKQA